MTRSRNAHARSESDSTRRAAWRLLAGALVLALAVAVLGGLGGAGSDAPLARATSWAGAPVGPASAWASVPLASTTSTGATTTSGTPDATAAVVPTPTATFARLPGTSQRINFPAAANRFIAVGFHQAENTKAIRFVPSMTVLKIDAYAKTRARLRKDPRLKLFQQRLRGRGDSNLTAADCAVKPNTIILAPVSGVVTNVRHYRLYGYIDDMRVEIKPDGAPRYRVVEIHIKSVTVKAGDRVIGGVTPVATVRHLKLDSTVNHYLPTSPADHVHVQVNRDTFRGSY